MRICNVRRCELHESRGPPLPWTLNSFAFKYQCYRKATVVCERCVRNSSSLLTGVGKKVVCDVGGWCRISWFVWKCAALCCAYRFIAIFSTAPSISRAGFSPHPPLLIVLFLLFPSFLLVLSCGFYPYRYSDLRCVSTKRYLAVILKP
jgi:hypothetical protein